MPSPKKPAAIYCPDRSGANRWLEHCYLYCVVHNYTPLHVVRRFADVVVLLAAGAVAVVVTCCSPSDMTGIEWVTGEHNEPKTDPARLRPDLRRRWEDRR